MQCMLLLYVFGEGHWSKQQQAELMQSDLHPWGYGLQPTSHYSNLLCQDAAVVPFQNRIHTAYNNHPDVSEYEQAAVALGVNRQVPRFAFHMACWGACCDLVYQILGFE